MKPPVIAICTPVYDTYEPLYQRSMRGLMMPGALPCPAVFCESYGKLYEHALMELTEAALRHADVTHLLFVDADMAFPPTAPAALLARRMPIVGGLCFERRPPFNPTLVGDDGRVITEWQPGALVPVQYTGAAFLMIERDVFKAIGTDWWKGDGRRSPDACFLDRAREWKFGCFVDTAVGIGHIGKVVINEEFWRRHR